ncbi:MAG: ribokinase [Rhizobiaceae bacterium]
MTATRSITVLGVFVADTTYRADRPPRMGETVLGNSFALGPGGKGSNQAVAAARLGADVTMVTRLGDDAFADMADRIWSDTGVKQAVVRDPESYTGAAYIFVEEASGDNAIIVCPGAAGDIDVALVEQNSDLITRSSVFMTQLEQPVLAARRALEIAHGANVLTILNPAPAAALDDALFALCDYVTPNETEAAELTGLPVTTIDEARCAGDALLAKGAKSAVITLGEQGALLHTRGLSEHINSFDAGPVIETTGAGDAFNGGLATGLAEALNPLEAVRLGCATAGISITRPGTASSMPSREEVDRAVARAQ